MTVERWAISLVICEDELPVKSMSSTYMSKRRMSDP
jgi:hypothetical protein